MDDVDAEAWLQVFQFLESRLKVSFGCARPNDLSNHELTSAGQDSRANIIPGRDFIGMILVVGEALAQRFDQFRIRRFVRTAHRIAPKLGRQKNFLFCRKVF